VTAGVAAVFDVTHLFCGIVNLLVFVAKVRDLRNDCGNWALRAMCAARLCNSLAFISLSPFVYVAIGRWSGIDNLGALVGDTFVITGACATHVMLVVWFTEPDRAGRTVRAVICGYLIALILMAVFFLRADFPGENPVDFEVTYASLRNGGYFCVVFCLTYGLNLANTAVRTWPPSRSLSRPQLRSSLRLCAVGSVFVIGFIGGKLAGVIGRWCGTCRLDLAAVLVSPVFAEIGSLVIVGGYTVSLWRRRIAGAVSRIRCYRRLYPLWYALYEASPGIALYEPRSPRPPRWVPRLETRLYRLIIELRDGRRSIAPYLCAKAPDPGADARLEAALLAEGIRRTRRGAPPVGGADRRGTVDCEDLASELAWWQQVAAAFAEIRRSGGPQPSEEWDEGPVAAALTEG
jgi:hypothetical protein